MADDGQGNDNTCVVCFKNLFFYSIGECDHPVCYECSTRMRVLCQQNECPICRHKLDKVIFTGSVRPYKELHSLSFHATMYDPQYCIGFCNKEVKKAYERLLEHRCKPCKNIPPFKNFSALNDHMRKVHERQFCDLCVKNLKIFTFERKCYTRQELAHHRRKGDPDDTSHRGHPLCEFCEERFMDADELYRHLRKEHLYCHLCDADGRNYYYASHDALAHHFRNEHYLCEEGECEGNHLTAVFRSEIDLKAHKANVHGKGLARAAARQARTLELQFNITPHPNASQQRQGYREREREPRPQQPPRAPSPPPAPRPPAPRMDPRSDADFPRLSSAPPPLQLIDKHYNSRSTAGLSRDDRNFPALNGGGGGGPSRSNGAGPAPKPPPPVSATIVKHSKPTMSIQLKSQPASASNFRLTQPTGKGITLPQQPKRNVFEDDDFPNLSVGRDDHPSLGVGTVQPPKVGLVNAEEMQALKKTQKQPQQRKQVTTDSTEAFPALSSASTPTAPPQWIKVTKTKDKGKAKQEPPPKPKQPEFNPVADFPTLPVNNTKPKKQTPPPPPPQTQPTKQPSKKEKKKQNEAKKEHLTKFNDVSSDVKNAWESASAPTPVSKNGDSSQSKKQQDLGNGDFNYMPNQYPPLGNEAAQSRPILNGVPPGFSKRPACDGMTFTNSSGQTFSAPLHTYITPPDFEKRNRALVKKFAIALGGTEAVEDFKVASRAFRDNIISADEFYHHCQAALGSQLENVFPELVALLPDIGKQQELMIGRKACAKLSVCSTCGQLLQPEDSIGHDTAHWPSLGAR